jgi:hypothetical protein
VSIQSGVESFQVLGFTNNFASALLVMPSRMPGERNTSYLENSDIIVGATKLSIALPPADSFMCRCLPVKSLAGERKTSYLEDIAILTGSTTSATALPPASC